MAFLMALTKKISHWISKALLSCEKRLFNWTVAFGSQLVGWSHATVLALPEVIITFVLVDGTAGMCYFITPDRRSDLDGCGRTVSSPLILNTVRKCAKRPLLILVVYSFVHSGQNSNVYIYDRLDQTTCVLLCKNISSQYIFNLG